MFPWNYGFHWSAASILFLGAFYTVLATVAATVFSAIFRARRDVAAKRTEEIRWHTEFLDLPPRDRSCRHMLTGELAHRECLDTFDCRHCETHARFGIGQPIVAPGAPDEEILGMEFPLDRFYHRGHTWARPEPDGTVTIGLDELGRRVLGVPDCVELPKAGARIRTNGTAWRVRKNQSTVRMLAPVDGEVVEIGGPDQPWYLRVKPVKGRFDLRHLLVPCEIQPWLLREVERLQLALQPGGAITLADGGMLVPDLSAQSSERDWEAACDAVFLQT